MSNEMFTALASVVTAIFTIFGVKLLDTVAGRQTKRFDELAAIRVSQGARITHLEAALDKKDQEFDLYQQKTNERLDKLNDELYALRAENRLLKQEVEKYRAETETHKPQIPPGRHWRDSGRS